MRGREQRPREAFCSFCRKSYRDVGPLVEGPEDVYICAECIELCQSIIDQEKRRRGIPEGLFPHVPASEAIQEKLDRLITGQGDATRVLSAAVRAHYERLSRGALGPGAGSAGKNAILLVGPTRSSRLFLGRALAHALDVPFATGSVSPPTKGRPDDPDAGRLLYRLLQAGDFDIQAVQRGLVYVDGVDQPEVQWPLLDMLDGPGGDVLPRGVRIEVTGILFLCGGRFAGLDEVIARGGRHPEQPVTAEDLIAFGMPPALAWRFQAVVRLAPLDEETLTRAVCWVDLKGLSGALGC